MAKVISATGAKGLWSLLLRLNNMTPLSTNGGESPQITEANAAKGRKKSCQVYAQATDERKGHLIWIQRKHSP